MFHISGKIQLKEHRWSLDEGVEENYIADWLLISGGEKEKMERIACEQFLSRAQRLNLLSEEYVRLQIKHLKNLSLIKNMHRKGDLPCIDRKKIW
jgi:hypothetical protein